MTWSNVERDHAKPISSFDVSNNDQLKKTSDWINTQSLIKQVHHHKEIKYKVLVFGLQFIEACQFVKLNDQECLLN